MRRRMILLVLAAGTMGCQSPFLVFSGGALTGPEKEVTSFAFANNFSLLTLEVRPERPYSVLLRVVMRGDDLYIDAAERRRWHTLLKQNSEVRVRLGDTVYPATAVRVDDPGLTSQFLTGRTIYRLVPRASSVSDKPNGTLLLVQLGTQLADLFVVPLDLRPAVRKTSCSCV